MATRCDGSVFPVHRKEIIMVVKASEGAAVPNPGDVKTGDAAANLDGPGATSSGPIPDSGKENKTADEVEALEVAAEAGKAKPPASEDKTAKGIKPSDDPARRIDEMTNSEAKQFSRDQANGDLHQGDESRPAGKADVIDGSTGTRSPKAEEEYRKHYSKGWNDAEKGKDNTDDYRDGGESTEAKSAYLAGLHGAQREQAIGHRGGDMKRGEFEKARVSGVVPQ